MKIVLVGTGNMALEYAKVLISLTIPFDVIGRSKTKADLFRQKYPEITVYDGGIENHENILVNYSHAIIATNVVSLCSNTLVLMKAGIKNILVEKPGIAKPSELELLQEKYNEYKPSLFIAYNRRFLASVLKAQEIINSDGGIKSFHFEFTEWSHVIDKLECDPVEKEFLFLANSTHVVDLAFYLGGTPIELASFTTDKLEWHPSSAIFTGSGISESGALFSYHSNWISAGRWSLEILTLNNRLIFKPLEKLQIQKINTIAINFVEDIDYSLDEQYKPGLYLQVKYFVEGNYSKLCSFNEQIKKMELYKKIANY